ncbi:cupin [Photobacterium aquae]|uniref:Cupin n=1 Tax=Photobacterium aquae TaxID=1195763 RepID=A0A0J1GX53_9GAMM|nr:cupin domain-containing protein [Photobacterium aquae]KLV04226.1 cupin [Photobacterium aquae]
MGNILADLPQCLPNECFEDIVTAGHVRIERIISKGHTTAEGDWYDQEEHEWVMVVRGRARILFEEGREVTLAEGDYINIPAHQRHRVSWTDPEAETIWLAVFYR